MLRRMPGTHYLALLRGINVGGNNIIKMADLKSCFEGMGLHDVTTYIQSGNVLFRAGERDGEKLSRRIEKTLSGRFDYASRIVLVTRDQLERIVEEAPRGFGKAPDKFRYDVIFLRKPMTSKAALESVSAKDGVDAAHAGKDALYFSRLTRKASQSHLARIIKLPVYRFMTIRNWNTTTKLLGMMLDGSPPCPVI
jgi:uncharacterized protein (DUF1697 family)